ncbi:MAG: CotH kinase family protein [Verrucomicrobiales bacterium]
MFASGKDRGAAGRQLHANFQLDSAGEYLALVGPGGVVAAEFAPAFPPQAEDVAYGTGADVLAVVGEVAPVRVLVPADDSLADAWTGGAEPFDDSGWALGAGPAGYDIGSAAGGLGGAKASADFAFRYEFDVQPNTQDLDGNATPDFWNGWDIGVIAGGVATMESTATARDGTVATDFGGSIWREHFLGGDWTLEIRFRVASQTGTTGAVAILAATNADNQENFWLRLGASDLRVTLPGGALETIDTSDNTDAMHVVRIARSGGRHYVWRDGVLLNASLAEADGYAWAPDSVGAVGLRTGLGIAGRPFSSSLLGTVEIDYLRLDDGGAFGYEADALYGGAIALDVEAAMRGVSPTLYARFPFQVPEDPAGFDALTLRARYDDGIVAYLNGVRAFSANAPDPAPWDASSTLDRGDSEALAESEIDLTASLGLLAQGSNVLAIHGLNSAADADRFLIGATLELSRAEPRTGYLLEPTPGAENGGATERPADSVRFTPDDSVFAEAVSVTLETDEPGGEIYFTADGSDPATSGQLYTGPVALAESAVIRAHVRAPGLAPSRVESRRYAKLAADVQAFASPLPVVVLDNFGAGDVPGKVVKLNPLVTPPGNDGGGIQQVARQPLVMAIFDRGESGEASPANPADLTALIGMRERGSSSSSLSKKAYSVEAWDRRQKERAIRPFGMPAESDWVLYAPTEEFGSDRYDRSLLHNSFIYALSNQIGRYAARTQFVEVFLNEDGGEVTMADYRGLYVFMEGIKRDEDRVDFEKMSWDGALGGWMLKIDRMDSLPEDDPGAVPQHFHTPGPDGILTTVPNADHGIRPSGGQPDDHPEFYHSFFNFDSPQGYRINAAQRQAIEGYLFDFEAALYGADWLAAGGGYRDWIDVPSFIDHYLLSNLAKNQDAFVLSTWVYREAPGSCQDGSDLGFRPRLRDQHDQRRSASSLMWKRRPDAVSAPLRRSRVHANYIDRWRSTPARRALDGKHASAHRRAGCRDHRRRRLAQWHRQLAGQVRNCAIGWRRAPASDRCPDSRPCRACRAAAGASRRGPPCPPPRPQGRSLRPSAAIRASRAARSPNAICCRAAAAGGRSSPKAALVLLDAGAIPVRAGRTRRSTTRCGRKGNAELGFGDGDEATPIGGGPIDARHPAIYFRRDFTVADAGAGRGRLLRQRRRSHRLSQWHRSGAHQHGSRPGDVRDVRQRKCLRRGGERVADV